jgi:aryl-alcohol dehydrogenase-like predicted oxidoreductase
VRFALEQSLKRLQTDYIDIYQMHNARMEQILDGALFELLDAFKAEGKIRTWGVALGPAIGWLWEGVEAARRNVPMVQMIWNMLEPFPGDRDGRGGGRARRRHDVFIRVPHSSGMLEGRYTQDTVFPPTDHRSHRPRQWLVNGIAEVERCASSSDRTARSVKPRSSGCSPSRA